MLEDFDERGAEAGEFVAGEAAGLAAGADLGLEECFVGIDVAYSVEEFLVEERGLDGNLAVAEEDDKVFKRDGEGLAAGAGVGLVYITIQDGEAAEAARIDETEFVSAA